MNFLMPTCLLQSEFIIKQKITSLRITIWLQMIYANPDTRLICPRVDNFNVVYKNEL